MAEVSVLIVGKGHAFDHNAFNAMLESLPGVRATYAEHPAAQVLLRPEHVQAYDVVFFYDMCGIPGAGLTHDRADAEGQPAADYRQAIEALVERGTGLLLLNHATVSWPHWPLWRAISATSFQLKAGEYKGQAVPGSGYRGGHGPLQNATVPLVRANAHPVVEGLSDQFSITDELYLKSARFEDDVYPLLRADYEFIAANFSPPPLAPPEEQQNWSHPPGSNLVAWANSVRNSPIVATDLGDGPAAFENPDFRRFVQNALHWLATAEARDWARSWSGKRSG